MHKATPLPHSQRSRIRAIAKAAWTESGGDFDTACLLIDQRMGREIGGAWVMQAITSGHSLCVWWSQNNILEPAAVAVFGEPGNDYFESDEES